MPDADVASLPVVDRRRSPARRQWSVVGGRSSVVGRQWPHLALICLIGVFGFGFGWLSVQRHQTYRTNAEDLGFTDQAIWNWLRGQAFRFTIYEKAEFKTDIDLAALKRPDSFLAFHVEPILALLAPLYLLWPDVRLMLLVQVFGWSLGAVPAYRLASRRLGSQLAGLAFAAVYLLSPFGQWAVLSDFHTVLLAAPLLLWTVDLMDQRRPVLFLLAGLLAAATKEEIGLIVAGLGLLACWQAGRPMRAAGLVAIVLGGGWSLVCVAAIIPGYAGTAVSPFTARYAELGGSPSEIALNVFQHPQVFAQALGRPEVEDYLMTLLLSGGWLALLAPEFLIPILPSLALNVLSSSPWMASGRAHYSSAILPLLVAAAVVGCQRLAGTAGVSPAPAPQRQAGHATTIDEGVGGRGRARRPRSQAIRFQAILASLALFTTAVAYHQSGAGPLSGGFAAPRRTAHHALADRVVARIPKEAKVTASSSLVPHLSQRPDIYLFPTIREAEYAALDVTATPFPISAGEVYLRTMDMLGNGEWRVLEAVDGLLLLQREASVSQPLPDAFYSFARAQAETGRAGDGGTGGRSEGGAAVYLDGALEMVSAELEPSGELGPNGPLGNLRSAWRTNRPLEGPIRLGLAVQLANGLEQEYADFAALWWYPPERWRPGELIQLDVPGLPLREVVGWHWRVQAPSGATPDVELLSLKLGELTVQTPRSGWHLTVLDPQGRLLWQEASLPDGDGRGPLGFRLADGSWQHLTEVLDLAHGSNGTNLTVATDDPGGRTATVTLSSLEPRSFRLGLSISDPHGVEALGQAVESPSHERMLGFGERFNAVDQRGRVVRNWAEDRRVAGYGDSTYAPLPFFISNRGYSLALETEVSSVFDLAATRADRYTWEAETSQLSLVFSYGPTPRDLVQQHVARSGLPPLPPIWAFGVWKTAIGGHEQVLDDAARLRELGVPVSALYVFDAMDADSNIGWPYITFHDKQGGPYGGLRELTDALHGKGFKALAYNTADFHSERANYAFPAERGYFLKTSDGEPYLHPGFGVSWVDFSNPEAVDWWGLLWKRSLVDLGFDGGMLDLGELTPADARYANGLDGRAMHNRYPVLYAQAAFEAAMRVKPDSVIFSRSGGAGAQAFQHQQWPGDPLIDWSEHNGFRSMVPAALSFGLSGFAYWGPEVGGYLAVGLPPDSERELWFRWLQLGAFSSVLRDNYGDHQTGSQPVEMWSDDETIAAFRLYARLHNRLAPYLYSYARVASESGLPIMRHLALNYPEDPRAWSEEQHYTLGDELLVAPVVDEGARTRTVYLPAGQWVDFWNRDILEGGREITADAPLDRIPVYARAGAVLAMAADFDSLAPSDDPTVRTWNGDLIVEAMPSNGPASSTFRLYDGTHLTYRTDGASPELRVQGAAGQRNLEVRLPSNGVPSAVLVHGGAFDGWRYESATRTVVLALQAADVTVSVQP